MSSTAMKSKSWKIAFSISVNSDESWISANSHSSFLIFGSQNWKVISPMKTKHSRIVWNRPAERKFRTNCCRSDCGWMSKITFRRSNDVEITDFHIIEFKDSDWLAIDLYRTPRKMIRFSMAWNLRWFWWSKLP
jgi:hypothetical protein